MVGRMTRSDMVIDTLLRKRPLTGHSLQGIYALLGALFAFIIFWGSITPFQEAVEIGEYVGAAGDFTAPTWPIRLLILIGSAAMGIQHILMAAQDFRIMLAGKK